MKFTLAVLATLVATASAHMSVLYPPVRGGFNSGNYDNLVHSFIQQNKNKSKYHPFSCGGYKKTSPITNLRAGQTIDVTFLASPMMNERKYLDYKQLKNARKLPKRPSSNQMRQPRHGGGLCQFSLSPDNGKTYHLIAQYTKTCPDAYYKWPVKIPTDAPSCTKKGQCLFVWSWTAAILPQYYHDCADINLKGSSKSWPRKPKRTIQIVDFDGRKQGVKEPGDMKNHDSASGPKGSKYTRYKIFS